MFFLFITRASGNAALDAGLDLMNQKERQYTMIVNMKHALFNHYISRERGRV